MARKLPNSKVKALLLTKTDLKRIAGEVVPQAAEVAAEFLGELGKAAAGIAQTFGRKTIMPEDLKQACKVVHGGPVCDTITSSGKIRRTRKQKANPVPEGE